MSLLSLPRMFVSEKEGWEDVVRTHPSVTSMLAFVVVPMSLIPPLMYAYAELVQPGDVFPLLAPALSVRELLFVGTAFFLVELFTVSIMAAYVRELSAAVGANPSYAEAYTLAAIAPIPLWLSSLGLFVPSMWFNMVVVALAWVASVALIRHGVRPLFKLDNADKAGRLTTTITLTGVAAWIGLMMVLTLLLSLSLGLR